MSLLQETMHRVAFFVDTLQGNIDNKLVNDFLTVRRTKLTAFLTSLLSISFPPLMPPGIQAGVIMSQQALHMYSPLFIEYSPTYIDPLHFT